MRGFDADIVVVCESWREHDGTGLLDPLAADGYRIETLEFATLDISGARPVAATPGEGRWELAICSRLPITARRSLSIGHIRNDPAGARWALACTVDVGGTPLDVVAVHVSSKLWKFASARQLHRLHPQLPTQGAAVVAGDCNLWGPGVVAMLPHWKRAVRGRTYPAPRPHSQIDHVLVNDRVAIVGGEVLAATPSDHRPVRARLRVSAPPGPGSPGGVG